MDTQGVYKKRSKGKTVREYAKTPTRPNPSLQLVQHRLVSQPAAAWKQQAGYKRRHNLTKEKSHSLDGPACGPASHARDRKKLEGTRLKKCGRTVRTGTGTGRVGVAQTAGLTRQRASTSTFIARALAHTRPARADRRGRCVLNISGCVRSSSELA